MSETIREMISEADLAARIAELGEQISKDYEGESVYVICILRGASFFACELAKRITVPVTIDFMTTSSYGAGTVSSALSRVVFSQYMYIAICKQIPAIPGTIAKAIHN